MPVSPVKKIVFGFGAAVLLLVAVVGVSMSTMVELRTTAGLAACANSIVELGTELHGHLGTADAATMAYLADGDASHLEERKARIDATWQALETLRELLANRIDQQERLDTIKALVRRKIDEQDRRVADHREATSPELLKWGTEIEKLCGQIHYQIDIDIVAQERARLGGRSSRHGSAPHAPLSPMNWGAHWGSSSPWRQRASLIVRSAHGRKRRPICSGPRKPPKRPAGSRANSSPT